MIHRIGFYYKQRSGEAMVDTSHIRKILEYNPYDSAAKRRLLEIGSVDDLEWLHHQNPYDSTVRERLIQLGNPHSLRTLLAENPYDFKAKNKLLAVGSLTDLEWLYDQNPYDTTVRDKILSFSVTDREASKTSGTQTAEEYDIFICHVYEDKDSFVKPLADALVSAGIRTWYDDFELGWGDSLRASIDRGLSRSRFGLVIFSKAFFSKHSKWTEHELDGLFAKESNGQKVILPIWHDVSREDVLKNMPAFADKLAKNSDSIPAIVSEVKKLLKKSG
ncbi:TIR domain protein [Candidatus Norongarragalina meridionalis]|nr:TIR domain protein [Candidatus Norongarragalina meridionalis]